MHPGKHGRSFSPRCKHVTFQHGLYPAAPESKDGSEKHEQAEDKCVLRCAASWGVAGKPVHACYPGMRMMV